MNNFCQNCGHSLGPGENFCQNCGLKVGDLEEQSSQVNQEGNQQINTVDDASISNMAQENHDNNQMADASQMQENIDMQQQYQNFDQQFSEQMSVQKKSKKNNILLWVITLVAVAGIVVAGNYYFFNHVFAQPEKEAVVGAKKNAANSSKTVANNDSAKGSTSNKAASSSSKDDKDKWNSDKESELKSFLDSWAPTMNQTYTKSTKSDMPLDGQQYYGDFGNKIDIGWSDSKNGPHDYNVVSVYNYNKQGSQSGRPGEYHITYAFSYHDGQPVALVSENTNGGFVWKPTRNTDVASNWQRIASE